MVTGQDLVEWQIRVASGEVLPLQQDQIKLSGMYVFYYKGAMLSEDHSLFVQMEPLQVSYGESSCVSWCLTFFVIIPGHSFEARIYAENVPKGFLPAAGLLHHYHPPAMSSTGEFLKSWYFRTICKVSIEALTHFFSGCAWKASWIFAVRVESGVGKGDAVSVFYDPMIAKLVVWGQDRSAALIKLHDCLTKFQVCVWSIPLARNSNTGIYTDDWVLVLVHKSAVVMCLNIVCAGSDRKVATRFQVCPPILGSSRH